MRILPISTNLPEQNFKGKYEYYYGRHTIKDHADWHPASSMEKALDAFHKNPTNKVYFASPMEPITDNIREAADYIVYDNEPKYPDIDEVGLNYFNRLRVDFNKDFKELKDYYDRREFAGFSNSAEARQNAEKAQKCIDLYNNGGHLRYVKEQAEDKIVNLEKENSDIAAGIEAAQGELSKQQDMQVSIKKHIDNLEQIKKPYSDVIKNAKATSTNEKAMYEAAKTRLASLAYNSKTQEHYAPNAKTNPFVSYSANKTSATYNEISKTEEKSFKITDAKESAEKEIQKIEETKNNFESVKAGCIKTIRDINANIDALKKRYAANTKEISEKFALIEDCKAKLIPIFDELKYFYANNKIKGVKKYIK